MVKIDKVSWGKVKVNNQDYHQVLIVGNEVFERDKPKLERLFGTTHEIGEWEQEKLLSGDPEIILVATGWSGVIKVSNDFKKKIEEINAELETALTPKVIGEYRRSVEKGKRVNALIHTTC